MMLFDDTALFWLADADTGPSISLISWAAVAGASCVAGMGLLCNWR